jgi:hypothetical protein
MAPQLEVVNPLENEFSASLPGQAQVAAIGPGTSSFSATTSEQTFDVVTHGSMAPTAPVSPEDEYGSISMDLLVDIELPVPWDTLPPPSANVNLDSSYLSTGDGLVIMDQQMRILDCNSHSLNMSKRRRSPMSRQEFARLALMGLFRL